MDHVAGSSTSRLPLHLEQLELRPPRTWGPHDEADGYMHTPVDTPVGVVIQVAGIPSHILDDVGCTPQCIQPWSQSRQRPCVESSQTA